MLEGSTSARGGAGTSACFWLSPSRQTRSAGRSTASRKFGRSTTSIVLPEAYLRPSARRSARVVFCAFQLFIPDLSYSSGFLPRNWRKPIGRAHRTETELPTSTLLRIPFHYRHITYSPF